MEEQGYIHSVRRVWAAGGMLCLLVLCTSPAGIARVEAQQNPDIQGPFVSEPVVPGKSSDVRRLPVAKPWGPGDPVYEAPPPRMRIPESRLGKPGQEEGTSDVPVPPEARTPRKTPSPIINFNGISFTGFVPPDPVGDVGPNHYVQMVNVSFAIFDKNGNLLTGPTPINALWAGQGNECERNNDGDPIVLYDPLADRWLLSQFAVPGGVAGLHMCIAISQTPDPTGAYFLYDFQVPDFPDYPKFGVWPDAYYMSTNEPGFPLGSGAYAFDRARMLAGLPASFIRFHVAGNFMLPSDLDGATPPPPGSPNYFARVMDDTFWPILGFPGVDRLEVFEFHADFSVPANSTFSLTNTLPTAPFIYTVCGPSLTNDLCIPQPSPGERLNSISIWLMWRLQYRNFGTHETLVGNFTVDADGTHHAGIRWFELRQTPSSSWSIFQEGIHAPDANHRWMGSTAMDRDGNLALGYSVSGNALFPSIRYATRLATDPAGTLQNEVTLVAGGGAQTAGFNRWGDYSSLNVDPEDDCTFWYTGEYYANTAPAGWRTRIGSFRLDTCGGVARVYDAWMSRSSDMPPFTPFHDCVSFTQSTMSTDQCGDSGPFVNLLTIDPASGLDLWLGLVPCGGLNLLWVGTDWNLSGIGAADVIGGSVLGATELTSFGFEGVRNDNCALVQGQGNPYAAQ